MISDLIWDGRLEHFLKAQFPIFVTLVGILMLVSDLHTVYLLLVDYQCYTL